MKTTVLTKSNVFIIGPVATLLGFIINALYLFLSGAFNIQNIGLCIILFTIVINVLMLPLTIKQQKSSKLTQVMNPELQAIAKKYKNKKDQASMMKMQEEQQAVYAKYGISPMGSCLPMLIQMPILFAMYQVIWKVPAYVKSVYEMYTALVNDVLASAQMQTFLSDFATNARVNLDKVGFTSDSVVDILHSMAPANWAAFADKFPDYKTVIEQTAAQAAHVNSFLTINITDSPFAIIKNSFANHQWLALVIAILIPVLAGLTQFISVKLQPQPAGDDKDNPMASSMKTMTYTMPLISVFMGFTLPAGLGLYWAASAAVRCIQQLAINKYLSTKSLDEMIKENQKKAQKKREKHGTSAKEINKMATTSTRNVGTVTKGKSGISEAEKEEKIQKAKQKAQNSKPGSLASKANLVSRYNSGQQTNQPKAEDESSSKEKKGKKK